MTEETTLRREPQQARSQKRVDDILNAAETLLVEVGYEGITTSAIAKTAGISVGSLYQFFANKDAVLYALGERYLAEMESSRATMFSSDSVYVPMDVLFDRAIDVMVSQAQMHRGYSYLFSANWVHPDLKAVAESMDQAMLDGVDAILAGKLPTLADDTRRTTSQTLVYMVKGLLIGLEKVPESDQEALVSSFKQAGVAFLATILPPK